MAHPIRALQAAWLLAAFALSLVVVLDDSEWSQWALWAAATTLAGVPFQVRSTFLDTQRRRRRAEGLCARCGYDLRATPNRCPECGGRRLPRWHASRFWRDPEGAERLNAAHVGLLYAALGVTVFAMDGTVAPGGWWTPAAVDATGATLVAAGAYLILLHLARHTTVARLFAGTRPDR